MLCKYMLTDKTCVLCRCRHTDKMCALHRCRHTDKMCALHRCRHTDKMCALHRCGHTDKMCALHRCRHTDKMCALHSCRLAGRVHVLHRCRHWAGSVRCTDVGICNAIMHHVDSIYFYLKAKLGVLVKVVFWELDTAGLTNVPQMEAFCEVRSLAVHRCVKIICHSW
jgi:hypothetical protein